MKQVQQDVADSAADGPDRRNPTRLSFDDMAATRESLRRIALMPVREPRICTGP